MYKNCLTVFWVFVEAWLAKPAAHGATSPRFSTTPDGLAGASGSEERDPAGIGHWCGAGFGAAPERRANERRCAPNVSHLVGPWNCGDCGSVCGSRRSAVQELFRVVQRGPDGLQSRLRGSRFG